MSTSVRYSLQSKSHLPRQRWQAEGFPHLRIEDALKAQKEILPRRAHTRIVKTETIETVLFETPKK